MRGEPRQRDHVAADNTSPGDVILIEQQIGGPRFPGGGTQFGYLPIEWLTAVRTAIQNATARGRIVVEAVSDPNVAMVGKRFAELDESVVAIGAIDFERQGRARAAQRNKGRMRLYADKADGRLLGAEMCVRAGEHIVHLLALAIERSLTVHELLRMPFYHPVLEEGLRSALRELAKQLPPCGDLDLAACDAFQVEALD